MSPGPVMVNSAGATTTDGPVVQRHQDLGVGGVAEEHLAPEPLRQLVHLVPPVADPVDMGVAPGELEHVGAVRRVGVVHRQPAERRPRVRGQRLRYYLTHSITHDPHRPCPVA